MTSSDKPDSTGNGNKPGKTDRTEPGSAGGDAEPTPVISRSTDGSSADDVGTQPVQSSSNARSGEPAAAGSPYDPTAPPPWQRVPGGDGQESRGDALHGITGSAEDGSRHPEAETDLQGTTTERMAHPLHGMGGLGEGDQSGQQSGLGDQPTARSAVSYTGSASANPRGGTNLGSTRRPSRGPRRASLQMKRIDPWSVLKLALVLSLALFFVWLVAVGVLYGVLDGMGVWDKLNGTFSDLTQPSGDASQPLITAGAVFAVAAIIGAINIVLFTALSTVAAFIYNVAADFAGGVEVTLSERE